MFLTPILVILLTLCTTYAKVYERCELARELRNFDLPEDEIPTWVCIAQHESNYDTTAMNPGSGDHGLFQISQIYWCSPPGNGYGCNSPCSKFRDDDIADDLQCIRRIYNEHTRISGDSFNAWVVYPLYCKNDNSMYVRDCFDQDLSMTPDRNATENEIPHEEVDEFGDGYQFPALPNFAKAEQENSSELLHVGDGYEFPSLPFSRISIHDSISVKDKSFNYPSFPYSKQSIHEFKLVNKPSEEATYKTTKKASKDVTEFQIGSVFSKQSIDYFVPVATTSKEHLINVPKKSTEDESEYNFPPLPKSSEKSLSQPIHNFTPAPKSSQKTILSITEAAKLDQNTKEYLINVPKKSTEGESEYNFPLLPKSIEKALGQSIHDFRPVTKSSEKTILGTTKAAKQEAFSSSPIYSKPSVYHFVPESTTPKKLVINAVLKIDGDKSDFNFTPLSKISQNTFGLSKAFQNKKISYTQDGATELIDSKLTKSSTTYKLETKFNSVTSKPITNTPETSSKITTLKINTIKPPSSTTRTIAESISESHKNPLTRILKPYITSLDALDVATEHYLATRKQSVFTNKLFTTTSHPFTTKLTPNSTTQKPIFISSKQFTTTTLKPLSTTSKYIFSTSGLKSLAKSLKLSTTKPSAEPSTSKKPLTNEKFEDYDLQGASSTLTPYTAFKPLTTTLKPILTFQSFTRTSSMPFTTQKTSFVSDAQRTSLTTTKKLFTPSTKLLQTPSTRKPFTSQSLTTLKPNFTYKSFTTAASKQLYTTNNPLSKQVTFAPDSFFSWIFGSQTLPPLVPPGRPPRPSRPSGERPGGLPTPSATRPPINERPGGFPRPPRPPRPSRIRPTITPDSSGPQEVSEFGLPSRRRPFGGTTASPPQPFSFQRKSDSVSPFTRKSLSEQRTESSTRISLAGYTTSTPKVLVSKDVVSPQKQLPVYDSGRQFSKNAYQTSSVANNKVSNGFPRSGFEPDTDEHVVEVKLDDNFVFLRTRFGYRLFRKN